MAFAYCSLVSVIDSGTVLLLPFEAEPAAFLRGQAAVNAVLNVVIVCKPQAVLLYRATIAIFQSLFLCGFVVLHVVVKYKY